LIPAVTFAVLSGLSFLIFFQQVDHGRSELSRHTDNVAMQASQRLRVFVESHLRTVAIFGRRWSSYQTRDNTRKRFDEFASVIVDEVAGYSAIGLVSPDRSLVWTVPQDAPLGEAIIDPVNSGLFESAKCRSGAWLSPPFDKADVMSGFYAALPVTRDGDCLGYLVVEFQTKTLIDDCFESQLRSEFDFTIRDVASGKVCWPPDSGVGELESSQINAELRFRVRNREWVLLMAPRPDLVDAVGWESSVPVLAFGLFLSLGLSLLVHQLARRMEMYRLTRDRALSEVEELQRAEEELKATIDERNRAMSRLASLSRKVLMAQEEERERLSRELHDELGQLLTALRLEMGWLQKQLHGKECGGGDLFETTLSLAETATDELRRICRGLRPPLLDDLGLEPAIRRLVDEYIELSKTDIELELELEEGGTSVPTEVGLCTYRILQESLTNVRRHSSAEHVRIALTAEQSELSLTVEDDGVGFEQGERGALRGFGLEGMRERAALVGGDIEIVSAPRMGTRIHFSTGLERAGKVGDT
jgi:signal transduction histidine kinase